ncbi:Uncharacterised protein [Serratia fonticola]|uniref:Uncharacterized protein n=1 Tax=Serratia fonticola TaxID=47917 RepID=A0A4U9WCG4_SERFO|nr:Uncharacterised protein [Serratia fonticola]
MALNIFTGQLTLLGAHGTGEETEYVNGCREIVVQCLMERFTAVQRFKARQMFCLPFDGIGNTQQDCCSESGSGP